MGSNSCGVSPSSAWARVTDRSVSDHWEAGLLSAIGVNERPSGWQPSCPRRHQAAWPSAAPCWGGSGSFGLSRKGAGGSSRPCVGNSRGASSVWSERTIAISWCITWSSRSAPFPYSSTRGWVSTTSSPAMMQRQSRSNQKTHLSDHYTNFGMHRNAWALLQICHILGPSWASKNPVRPPQNSTTTKITTKSDLFKKAYFSQ